MLDDDAKRKTRARLRRIGGQVAGIERMLEQDRYCVDVLLQIAAVEAALEQVGKIVLGAHVETCVSHAMESGSPRERREKVEELMEVFSRFGSLR